MPLLVALLLASAQVSKVSATFPPMPASAAVYQIAKGIGRNLAVAPALSEEILFVRLKDAPVDAVLSHIAEVLCAKWVKRANGITWLEPDAKALSRLEKSEADEAENRLIRSFVYLRKRLAQQPRELDQKAVDDYRRKKKAQDQRRKEAEAKKDYSQTPVGPPAKEESPAWRALARIVLQMDRKLLLRIPSDGREVWAENPTPMQHGFTDEAKEVLKTYRRELELLDPTLSANRVKLVFNKFSVEAMFNVEFVAFGFDGKPVDRIIARLNSYSELVNTPSIEPDHKDPRAGEVPLQPAEEIVEARKAQAVLYQGTDRRAIFAKWRPTILDPVRYEPTTWGLGEELVMAAESADRNLVGTVNDGEIGSEELLTKVTASQVFWKHRESLLPSSDGWLVFRSHDRMQRASRSKAKSLLANCVQTGGITVDTAARWAAESTDHWSFYNWVGIYVGLLFPYDGFYGSLVTMMNDDALRLWAGIGSTGIDRLRRGDVIRLSSLSHAAKSKIEEIAFWGALENGDDPTDRLPNGITEGTLTMSVNESSVFYGWLSTDGPPVPPRVMDPKEFGTLLAKGEPWNEVPPSVYQHYDRFRIGLHRKYKLNLIIEPGAIPITVPLTETLFNPTAHDVSDLPADLKSAVERARSAALTTPSGAPLNRVIPPR